MPNQPSAPRRAARAFRENEWELLVRLPGQVVVAATSAEADSPRRTVAEGLAGIEAIAAGRDSASRLVRDVVAAIYLETTEPPAAEEYRDPAAGIADVLADCRTAADILAARTAREDADAYRHWIEAVAARVCHAARSTDLLGFGGPPASARSELASPAVANGRRASVSPAEWRFLAELAAAFDR
jgi:hypothetical protein